MGYTQYLGRCLLFFFIAIFLDAVGLIVFFLGIFAPFSFWDFLVFSGPIIIFLSLFFWIFWYVGNLEVAVDDFLPK
ncbi:transmembrane protein 238-like [Oncorhynchus clarkii lewisi]|uniref:transmembrane protein 238-like n=1 Tax=Oncorhynchus clarkii lewisi TaxID=490388 RepID=UPI0039B8EECF